MRAQTSAGLLRGRGFTLVEVLVALAIVAIALAAASRSVALSTDSALDHKLRVLAGFVAENRMGELSARRAWPGLGASEGSESQAGIEFRWRAEVLNTPHPRLRRVEIQVMDPNDPSHELRRLVGVLAREL
jgi:general secretion pathway protein I